MSTSCSNNTVSIQSNTYTNFNAPIMSSGESPEARSNFNRLMIFKGPSISETSLSLHSQLKFLKEKKGVLKSLYKKNNLRLILDNLR